MAPKKTAPNTTKKGPQGSILNFFPRVSQAQSSSPAPLKAQEVVVRVSDASMPDGPSSRVPANSQPPFKRKAKPDSDSEAEPNDAVAHLSRRSPARSCIPSPTKSDKENINPPRKKPRTASPCPSPNPPVDDEPVPSSQSDEDELMPVHSTTDNTVDPPRPSTPEQAPGHQQAPLRTPQQKHLMSPLPATPVALTPRTKTAQIIADIKARAQAQAAACPDDDDEQPFRDLGDLSDSSDDELGEILPSVVLKSGPQPSAAPARSHYSLRDRSAQRVASASRKTPTPIGKSPPPPKKVDPFAALLKEKRNAERLGTGGQALRRAEEILSVGSPLSEMTDDEEETDWTNEDTALAAVKALAASSDGVNDRDDEITVNDKDHRRLLGDKAGKEVAAILGSDRARREAAKGKQKVIGVHLWQDDDRSTKIESAISLWALDLNGPPILALLHSSLESDVFRASALLNSGVLARMNLFAYPAVVSCIFEHASSPSPLAIAAFNALSHVWSSSSSSASIVSFDVVLSALYRAGAKEGALTGMGWAVSGSFRRDGVSVAERNDVLYRLVRLIALSTQSPLPASEDASSIIMALVLIGMDPTILPELRREIMGAIDLLCRSLGSDDQVAAQEPSLGRKLLQFALTLHSHNQSHLLALLAGGSERGRRIARWVAHTVISAAPEAQYSDLPPLAAVLNILSPTNERKSIFELHEDTDYVELVSQVQILGIALSNVDGYVKQEAQQRQLAPVPPSSPSKLNNEKPETILSRIRFAIETLHGNIVDTRAARLDRSRAKAALKQLSMRIHYQQEVALKSVRGAKMSRPIQQYFAKSK